MAIYDSNGSWISLVDPGDSSSAFENNNGTLYIRAEQGSGNSEIIFQTGTSNYEQRPSISGSNRVKINNQGVLLVNMETSSGVAQQNFQVTGGAYISGNTGIGISNATSKLHVQGDELVTGVVTATRFYGEFVGTGLSITGISTIGILSASNLTVSGIVTVGSLYVDASQVLSNDRRLLNITSIQASGITTLGITSLSQLNVSGVSTFNGLVDINGGVTANSATVENLTNNRIVLVGAGSSLKDDPNFTFDGYTFNITGHTEVDNINVSGVSTFAGLIDSNGGLDVTGHTELDNLNVSGVSTFAGIGTFTTDLYVGNAFSVDGQTELDDVNVSGIATITTIQNTTANITNLNATRLVVSGVSTFQDHIHLGDGDAIYLGTDDDMRIFHDGGAAYIDNDTGILYYRSGQHFFENAAGTETFASFVGDGSISLYYDNTKKFETLGTGVTVTGTVYAQNFSTGDSGIGININNNTITGPSSIVIDPAGVGDNTGAVRIKGDFYVDGTQFIVNSSTIELADLRVGIATTVGSNLLLDGGGIGIGSANVLKTFTYNNSSDTLQSSIGLGVTTGGDFKTGTDSVLNRTTLGQTVVNSSLTSVGTLTNLNVAGVVTATTFNGQVNAGVGTITTLNGSNATYTTLTATNGFVNTGIITNLTSTAATLTNINSSGIATLGVVTATQLYVSGITTTIELNVGVGGTVINTTVSGRVGINSLNPAKLLDVNGDINFNGILYQNGQEFIASNWVKTSAGIHTFANVGIGTTNPAYDLEVLGDVRLRGGIYDNTNNSAGLTNQVVVADGSGGWSWQPVTAAGAGTLDGIEVRDNGSVVGTSGSITTLDFVSTATSNIVVTGYAGGNIATITLSDTPTFGTINASNASLGFATASSLLVSGVSTFTGLIDSNGGLDVTGHTELDNVNISGFLTATSAIFSGNVSIGGTLTYEDVTNIDSIGIITARSDVIVGGGLSVTGITTLASAGGITTTGGDLYVGDDLFFKGNLYQNGQLFTAGIGIGSTATNPQSGLITPAARIGVGFTDINFVGTGLSVTGYGSTIIVDFGNISGGGGVNVSISTAPPGISTSAGNLWWDSDNGDLKIYYSDGNSSQWIDANGGSQALAIISESSPAGYGITSSGTLWWDSTSGVLKVYYDDGDSTQWVDANSGAYINYWVGNSAGIHTLSNVGIGTTNPQTKLEINGVLGFTGGNVKIGNVSTGSSITTGSSNNFIGNGAGQYTTSGYENNFFGAYAGQNNIDGFGNIFLGGAAGSSNISGNYNHFSGVYAGYANTTGNNNVYIGYAAGANETGSENIILGSSQNTPISNGSNQLVIGSGGGTWINGNSSYNVGIGTTNPTEKLQVNGYLSIDGNVSYGTTTFTTSSIAQVGIHSTLSITTYRSVEYTIQATQGTNFHTTKIIALHDGSLAYPTEYGFVYNNSAVATYDVDVSGGNMRLLATPASASTTNFKIIFNGIKV